MADKYDDFVDMVSHPLEFYENESKRLAKKAIKNAKKAAAEVKAEIK